VSLITLEKNVQNRTLMSRTALEEEITKAVKADDVCAAFVGVILERIQGQSSLESNWAVKGIKFGTADRDKAGHVVEAVVERMQSAYNLSNDRSD
jgi:hypothetical protein